ncbi:hypothetical protein ABZ454_32995 [Streptomyces sp. NPDC005803]
MTPARLSADANRTALGLSKPEWEKLGEAGVDRPASPHIPYPSFTES